ncbi:hypothetical protein BSFA1_20850 [Burkholderia sp. SFA1]|uniref:hypothetical protein n=1 Tax=unclassified Caballeronia TaxID=2646786 RepID=UPI0002DB0C3C|nr:MULTISPECIES: hypothetical protein [unclassified Caballeronia]MCE4541037.1 hypothetical protein [Caballeronia sp. PC1]MCE4569919.1 hypothetical protein [Caballeronia sp. CLC5]BBP96956.1 hypothetical protein BSFA1_20850 [Burkholderia sp. SFA1]
MALDSSLSRGDASDAHQKGETADEAGCAPAARPAGSAISVTLWDEVAPTHAHGPPPLDDDSPEA